MESVSVSFFQRSLHSDLYWSSTLIVWGLPAIKDRSGPGPLRGPCWKEHSSLMPQVKFLEGSLCFHQLPLCDSPIEKQTISGCHQISFKKNKKTKTVSWSLLQLKYWYPGLMGQRNMGNLAPQAPDFKWWRIHVFPKTSGSQKCRCFKRAYFQKLKCLYQQVSLTGFWAPVSRPAWIEHRDALQVPGPIFCTFSTGKMKIKK